MSVYLNDGTGKFGAPVTSTFNVPNIGGFGAIVAGDVNEDGKQDLIVAPIAGLQYDVVLLGNGDGTFTEKGQISTSYGFQGAALVDINGDKHLDLIAAGNGSLYVHLGDGQGNFIEQPLPQYTGDLFGGVTLGDFNGDKALDFVATSVRMNQLLYFSGNGDGTFQPPSSPNIPYLLAPSSIASADFNGDGKPDILLGSNDVASIVLGNGDGTFQAGNVYNLPLPTPTNLAQGISPLVVAADMNGDGKIDAVAADDGSDTMNVLLNDGSGNFSETVSAPIDDGTAAVQVADLNGDGLPDVILINYKTEKISYFLSIARTTPTVSIQSSAQQSLVGALPTITVQVTSSGSHPPTGTITLSSGMTTFGQQTLSSSGQSTFTLPALSVGQYPLTAAYNGDTYNNSANSISGFIQEITDFQISLPTPTQTVAVGATATYNLAITPQSGFAGSVSFACAGLPTGYTCSAQPVSVTSQATNGSLTVSPPESAATKTPVLPFLFHSGSATFLALGGLCFYARRRRISQLVFYCLTAVVLVAASGCSGSSSASKPSGYTGTSTLTITASTTQGATTVSHQASATLVVQ